MRELNHKESWASKNWCFWTVVWRLLRVPWTVRRANQSIRKENSPEYSLEGLMLKQKLQYFGCNSIGSSNTDAKNWLIGKDPDVGKDWRQKGTTEDEMVGWYHWLYGHEFEWALGVGDGQGGLACCSSWGHKESDRWATELNWKNMQMIFL